MKKFDANDSLLKEAAERLSNESQSTMLGTGKLARLEAIFNEAAKLERPGEDGDWNNYRVQVSAEFHTVGIPQGLAHAIYEKYFVTLAE